MKEQLDTVADTATLCADERVGPNVNNLAGNSISPERGNPTLPPRGFSVWKAPAHWSVTAFGGYPLEHPGGSDCALSSVSCGNFKSPAREERLFEKSLKHGDCGDSGRLEDFFSKSARMLKFPLQEGWLFMQNIYIFKTTIAGLTFLKIGRAINPHKRLKGVQTGCPMKIDVHAVYQVDNALRVEHDCHLALRKTNTVGEWFSCSLEDAERIVHLAIGKKTRGRNRKRYGIRPKSIMRKMAFFSDDLDKI